MDARKSYYAWFIDLIPETAGYSFKCWLPERNSLVSDRTVYPSFDAALIAAKERADLEVASWALSHFLNYVQAKGKISAEERESLAASVMEIAGIR